MLWKKPGFTVIAVFTLALGIGANTAIFSVINGVLLRQLAFHDPERLIMLWTDSPAWRLGFHELPATPADLPEWRATATSFEQLAAFQSNPGDLSDGGEPERVGWVLVSAKSQAFCLRASPHGAVRLRCAPLSAQGARGSSGSC